MRGLFLLGILLLGALKFHLLFFIPIVIMLSSLTVEINREIRFSQKELTGPEYVARSLQAMSLITDIAVVCEPRAWPPAPDI